VKSEVLINETKMKTMKKVIGISLILFFGLSSVGMAQDKDHTKEIRHDVSHTAKAGAKDVKKGAKAVGHKTAEVASKGKSKVVDKTVKDRVGPNGETIYISNDNRYYWVDKKGHKNYVVSTDLKAKE
jgi:hypothetical protein